MEGKTSPLAKALRTFAALMVAPLALAAGTNWFGGDAKLGASRLTLAVIAAALGGLLAALTALTPQNPTTPLSKAVATFLQGTVAGMATVAVADITSSAGVEFLHVAGAVVISAALAAIGSFAVNSAEDQTPAPVPPPEF